MGDKSVPVLRKSLRYFVNRVSGFSKQTVQFTPVYSGPYGANSQITARLPANSLVDLKSFVMRFKVSATCDTSNSGTSAAWNLVPPRHSSSFIRRFDTFLNGQQVALAGLDDYGSLAHIRKNLTCGADKITELSLYEGGAPLVAPANAATTLPDTTYLITHWEGLFEASHGVRFLPLNAAGQCEIRLTLAPASIFSTYNAVNTGTRYTMSDVLFYIDVISFADGFFEAALRQQLGSGEGLVIPFKNFSSFTSSSNTTAATVNFQLNTGSLDALYGTLRAPTHDIADQVYSGTSVAPYHKFISDGSGTLFSWQVNQIQYPQFPLDVVSTYAQLKNSFGGFSPLYVNSITSLADWWGEKFVVPLSLEMTSEDIEKDKVSSGLSTQGANVPIQFRYSSGASSGGTRQTVFAEYTSIMRIYAVQNIVVEL
jgi:hypothetical protein